MNIIDRMRRALLGAATLFCFAPVCAEEARPYTVAVLPAAPPVTMNALWTPFIEQLAKATGLAFRLRHYERMAEFERDIWNGAPDFIFSSPIQEAVAHQAQGYVPLVRARKLVNVGLFVRADSPIRSVDDLRGRTITFVGNKNICSVTLEHLLSEHRSKLNFNREYAGSTRNVIISILRGKTDAGAIFVPEMDRESEETRAQLREVVATPDIAPHPFSAHPRVPRGVQEAVAAAILAMAASPDGAETLKTVKLHDPVRADYGRDYASLEAIDIKTLTNWGQ